jgi:hypothetical protein
MATWATTFWPPSAVFRARSDQPTATTAAAAAESDPLALPGLPNDDVHFYCKRIDNSRLVRQADTEVRGELTAIAGAFAAAMIIAGMMIAPGVKNVMDSYKIQDLRHEQALLQNERRRLEVEEERVVNAARLDTLAPAHNLVRPGADQVIRLQPKNNHSFAMNGFRSR